MNKNNFRQKLNDGEQLIGTMISLPSPEIVELLAEVGFDWLFIDAEHGSFGPTPLVNLLQAAGNCPCLVRVPQADESWIKKVLDAGAAGIIVPQIHSANEASSVVKFAKYPPMGNRGVGLGRAHRYGLQFSSYLENANEETVIVVQIESRRGLGCVDEIAAVEGIDAILIGPYDLSASLGYTGQTNNPVVQDAIHTIRNTCLSHYKRLGIFGIQPQDVMPYQKADFTLLTVGVDTLFIENSASFTLNAMKNSRL